MKLKWMQIICGKKLLCRVNNFQRADSKIARAKFPLLWPDAGGRVRTDTVLLPMDFESITSANSITPAQLTKILYRIARRIASTKPRL